MGEAQGADQLRSVNDLARAAGIARKVIPHVRPPVCCVQYALSTHDTASNVDCTP
jgi:hypothetical protein